MTEKKSLTIRLDEEEREFVERKAEQEDRSVAAWLRRLIRAAMSAEPPRKPKSK